MWQELVILFMKIQRGLREMEAWLMMMKYWERREGHSSTIPMVNGERLGVWLNGASEIDGHWLLHIGIIPIYIIHCYAVEVDFPICSSNVSDRQSHPYLNNFIDHTVVEHLNSADWNSYLTAFRSSNSGPTLTHSLPGARGGLLLGSGVKSCPRSSSWAFHMVEQS
jgi:hypothetical protein